jgi:peroxiredoxin
MTTAESRAPVQPGQPAPDFTLPTVPDAGLVSLADYRGRSPLLLVLLRTIGR